MVKRCICIWLMAAAPAPGIVSMAPVEVGDTAGVFGNLSGSYVTKSGNTEKDEYEASCRVGFDSAKRAISFLEGSYERTEADEVRTEDETFFHARYLHRLHQEALYGEVFFQTSRDTFKDVDLRWLAGMNLRWRCLSGESWGKLYLGVGAFQEEIDYVNSSPDPDESAARFNSYLAYSHQPAKHVRFSVVGYYQPAVEQVDDRYSSVVAEVKVDLISELFLSLQYSYEYDSMPASGVDSVDRKFATSLGWEF